MTERLGVQVEGGGSMSPGSAWRRRAGWADRGKEAEGRSDNGVAGPMPAAAIASHRASVPDEQPSAWATPSWLAAAFSNAATGSPRMNCWASRTCPTASIILMQRLVLAFEVQHWYRLQGAARPRGEVWGEVVRRLARDHSTAERRLRSVMSSAGVHLVRNRRINLFRMRVAVRRSSNGLRVAIMLSHSGI